MRLLLDTHVFLWWLRDDRELSQDARRAIGEPSSVVHVSAATVWEASSKERLGRLDLKGADLVEEIDANHFVGLPISARHAQRAGALPMHHRDPFDRMLIAQAAMEDLLLVTRDEHLSRYGVRLLAT